jgi:hypothetical protein
MLRPCYATTMPFWKRLLKATAQRGMVMACVNYNRSSRDGMWATSPHSASSGYRAEFHEGCYQKHTYPFNWRTSRSDITGYHADFHVGHGTVGEWQGRGMACVNKPLHVQERSRPVFRMNWYHNRAVVKDAQNTAHRKSPSGRKQS